MNTGKLSLVIFLYSCLLSVIDLKAILASYNLLYGI